MSEIIELPQAIGTHLCTVSFYRRPDGAIAARLDEMPPHVIEAEETISARFYQASEWVVLGSVDLIEQGFAFEDGEE